MERENSFLLEKIYAIGEQIGVDNGYLFKEGALFVYESLRRQIEANELEQEQKS